MGFDIPEPYVWDESFKVFYDTLDRQHQQLFQKIFKLSACKDDRRELDHFKRVISEHFSQEEELMSKADYADYDIHHMEHQEFLRIIRTFATPVTAEQVRWIKDWLVNHIKGTDLQYKGKL